MKRQLSTVLLLALCLTLCACGGQQASSAAEPAATAPAEEELTRILLQGDTAQIEGRGAAVQGAVVTIGAAGSYSVSGSLEEGQLRVDTGDQAMEVTLILENASITNSTEAALHIQQARNLRLQLVGENRLVSGRPEDMAAHDETASGAALYTEDDLDIEGEGSLELFGYINNGLTCKDDLDINSGTLTITAANNGVRASESLELKGGTVSITAGNDGLKTTSTKKAGKGYVDLIGGSLYVRSGGDGVSSVAELRVSGGEVRLFTDKQALQAEGPLTLGSCELLAVCDSLNQAAPASSETPYLFCPLKGRRGDALQAGDALSAEAECDYKTILWASAKLQSGETLELGNGRESQSITVQ